VYKEFYASSTLKHAPLFAMGLFFLFFIAVLVRTFALKRRGDFEPMAALPLSDDACDAKTDEVNP
jgi:cbb3-type cytochrome oxidase subunit 3